MSKRKDELGGGPARGVQMLSVGRAFLEDASLQQ